jgi:hypothetical protein
MASVFPVRRRGPVDVVASVGGGGHEWVLVFTVLLLQVTVIELRKKDE